MTAKEKLYLEYIQVKNALAEIKGEKPFIEDVDGFVQTSEFKLRLVGYKKEELRTMITGAKNRCRIAENTKKNEEFLKTPKGVAFLAEREKLLVVLNKDIIDTQIAIQNDVNAEIKDWLGGEWGVNVRDMSMEVGIIDTEKEIVEYNGISMIPFIFGHTFEVYYDRCYTNHTITSFSMNYGAMMGFELMDASVKRPTLLNGMSKFANDFERLGKLKDMLQTFVYNIIELQKKRNLVQNEIRNPLGLNDY